VQKGGGAAGKHRRIVLAWLMVASLGAVACGGTEARLPDWDFFGVVADVASEEPLAKRKGQRLGGPDSEFLSRALTITFEDGQVVDVPSGTPGSNWCRELGQKGSRNRECVLAGAFDASGDVAWFEVLREEKTRRQLGGGRHVTLQGIERLEAETLTIRGIPFPVHSDVRIECMNDVSTLEEAIAADQNLRADVSVPDGTVINVWCAYDY